MKYLILSFITALALIRPVAAQIQVSCRVEPQRAVLHEPVIATVRVSNNTGQTITLRDDRPGARLWLSIEQSPGRPIRQTAPFLLGEPMVIPAHQSVTRRINITQSYDLRQTGPYTVRARVDWAGETFMSGNIYLDVVPGLEIDRLTGAAAEDGSGRRLYRLLTLNRERGEHLFLRIDDQEQGLCYGVIHLGRSLRSQGITMQLDASNRINVLHQSGPGRYLHHVVSPNGNVVTRRAYTSDEPGVSLSRGRDGRMIVDGATTSLQDDP